MHGTNIDVFMREIAQAKYKAGQPYTRQVPGRPALHKPRTRQASPTLDKYKAGQPYTLDKYKAGQPYIRQVQGRPAKCVLE